MTVSQILLETIDLRSFSNLWFWIGLALVWGRLSYWVMGVPTDIVLRAQREGGAAEHDLTDLLRIYCLRLRRFQTATGHWGVGLICCLYTSLFLLGFVFAVEFAQAVFLLTLPMILVLFLNIRFATHLLHHELSMPELFSAMGRHRFVIRFIGFCVIVLSTVWGMYWNLRVLF